MREKPKIKSPNRCPVCNDLARSSKAPCFQCVPQRQPPVGPLNKPRIAAHIHRRRWRRKMMRRMTRRFSPAQKAKARSLLWRAVRAGTIKRLACEATGCSSPYTHGHHYDYSRPLAVIWLCRWHHRVEHGFGYTDLKAWGWTQYMTRRERAAYESGPKLEPKPKSQPRSNKEIAAMVARQAAHAAKIKRRLERQERAALRLEVKQMDDAFRRTLRENNC